ncbi:MAG: microcystin degradation protein MlrC, partial [Verrucomicrobiales bacterium]
MSAPTTSPRIAMIGMASENCTFSIARTILDDFHVLEGESLQKERYDFLDQPDFEAGTFLPLMHARALPGGMITAETYTSLKADLLGKLEAELPVDAVYLDLHGAMHIEGLNDAEADLVGSVRALVGDACLLGASMDLHGNVSAALVDQVDLFSAYRTAPHMDTLETREKVCRLLLETLHQGWQLERAWVPIPVLLPGEMTSTLDDPGQSLYAGLTDFDDNAGILDVSLWVGYVWADEKRAHGSVVVTGIRDQSEVSKVAEDVATRYWEARDAFRFNVPSGTLSECLDHIIRDTVKPIVLSDSGDNPTAGGVGNLPYTLHALTKRDLFMSGQKQAILVGLWDAASVQSCTAAGLDAEIDLTIGQGCDSRYSSSLQVRATVKHFFEHDPLAGRQVIIQIGKGIRAVLTERRKPFHYFSDFYALGLKPEEADL